MNSVSAGEFLSDGNDVPELTPGAYDVAMVFQYHAPYPHMSVCETMGKMHVCLQIERADVPHNSGSGGAIDYSPNHWAR